MGRGIGAGVGGPRAAFRQLAALWIQVTGTWCNLSCTHCFNDSGPKNPRMRTMDAARVRAAIDEGVALGMKEVYCTGGGPFLHPEVPGLLAPAPTTVLSNGTPSSDAMAHRLTAAAAASRYSLEVRPSVDALDPAANDAIRGVGVFRKVLGAARAWEARGPLPILTVPEIALGPGPYDRLREMLLAAGLRRPRIKIMPVFHMGRLAERDRHLTPAHLVGFDDNLLRWTEVRAVAAGGVYSNHLALRETLRDAVARGAEALFCLGDLGAFGPHPDKAFPLLRASGARPLQGNYDMSLAQGRDDCFCGSTDPRDNHFARLSYQYTFRNTSAAHKAWMGTWPREIRVTLGEYRVLMCHGSPRQINELLWESTTPDGLIATFLRDGGADLICCTHTGIKWHRAVPAGHPVNAGAIGRPENDGTTRVWYAMLTAAPDLQGEFWPVPYDHEALAREMEAEGLPPEFAETIRTGWWTTCLEILPAKERARGRY